MTNCEMTNSERVAIIISAATSAVANPLHSNTRSVRIFQGVPLSKRGVSFSNFGTVRGPTQ